MNFSAYGSSVRCFVFSKSVTKPKKKKDLRALDDDPNLANLGDFCRIPNVFVLERTGLKSRD